MDRPCGNCGTLTDSTRGYFAHIGGRGDYVFTPVCDNCRAKDAECWREDGKCPIGLGRRYCLSCSFQLAGNCRFERIAQKREPLMLDEFVPSLKQVQKIKAKKLRF